jgi:hypothetical protein
MPLRISHARELPSAIHSLSASLTNERGAGPKPGYLSDPRMLAAYAWYFLPWNLYRLTRLLRGLDLDIPDGATVVDAGAGPLTLVQALWIAAPRLRSRRLSFVCLDRSRAALALGKEMFLGLAGEDSPWRVEAVREELPRLPRGVAHLVTAVNVLNELAARRSQSMSDKTALLARTLSGALVPGGRMLLVEPGVRASGKLLSRLRENLVEDEGLALLAPCPHAGPCPLAARGTGTWCHFTVDAVGVPRWLEALSKRAGLPKRDVSLSFLFAGDRAARADAALGRVVSNPFPAPGREGEWARYACASGGLRLYVTPSRGGLVPGDLARTQRPERPVRDKKSGAAFYILEPPPRDPRQVEDGQAAGPARATPRAAASAPKRPPRGADSEKRPPRGGPSEKKTARGGPGATRPPQGAGGPKKAGPKKPGPDASGAERPSRRTAPAGAPPRKARTDRADRKKNATGGQKTSRPKDAARDAD